jgi:hypothetical protein
MIHAVFLNIHHGSVNDLALLSNDMGSMLLRFKTQSVRPKADPSRVTGMDPKKTTLWGNPLQQ